MESASGLLIFHFVLLLSWSLFTVVLSTVFAQSHWSDRIHTFFPQPLTAFNAQLFWTTNRDI